ncbi:MAG: NAD-dependent epimerase/dehydratase family protein, partial [Chloroflexota bacterium]
MKRQPQVQIAKSQPVTLSIDRLQATMPSLISRIRSLQGPILVVGAQEFTGATLLKALLQFRQDAYGATISLPAWRLKEVAVAQLRQVDLLNDASIRCLIDDIKPRTIFNCTSYETCALVSTDLVYETRFLFAQRNGTRSRARQMT